MTTTAAAKTLPQVRDNLCQTAADVMADPRRCAQVHESVNALGKAVGACKVYLEHCKLTEQKPKGDWSRFITGDK